MTNRRTFLMALPLCLVPSLAMAKKLPDWQKGAEEIEEAKFEKAFQKLKNDEAFQKAVFAGDADRVIQFFNKSTRTDYNVDVSFRGKGKSNISFAINCHKNKDGQWQFSITLSRR